MPQPWDGKTERRNNAGDHDNITRIITILDNHVKNFDKHVEEDKVNFGDVNKKVQVHAQYIYIGIGIIAVLQFLLKH